MFNDQASALASRMHIRPNLIGFASGMGGYGKTSISLNVAALLARRGLRVLVLDADDGFRTASERLGQEFLPPLGEVASGEVALEDALGRRTLACGAEFDFARAATRGAHEVNSVFGASGRVDALIDDVCWAYDCVLVDTRFGIQAETMRILSACSNCLVVTTDEPSAMTDAYAVRKVLASYAPEVRVHFIANLAETTAAGWITLEALRRATEQFLQTAPRSQSVVRQDDRVREAAKRGDFLLEMEPDSPAVQDMAIVARKIAAMLGPVLEV